MVLIHSHPVAAGVKHRAWTAAERVGWRPERRRPGGERVPTSPVARGSAPVVCCRVAPRTVENTMRLARTAVMLAAALAACSPARSATPAPPATPPASDAAAARAIDAYTRPLVARGELSGQLLVTRRGRVLAERSYGQADAELAVPVSPETRFNIASLTKPMT